MLDLFRIMILSALPVAGLLVISVGAELAFPRTRYNFRARFPGALYVILLPAALVLVSWPLHQIWDPLGIRPTIDLAGLNPLLQFALLLLVYDFLRYWEHRFEHRFWWPVHATHHSITELHASNVYTHPLQGVPEFFIVVIPFSLIQTGSHTVPFAIAGLMAFQNLIIHSPLTLHAGPLRRLFVDSRFHRIHHSLEERHRERNFGFLFSLWDRLFGSAYMPGADEWPEVGIVGSPPPRSFGDYLVRPFHLLAGARRRADAVQETG